MYRDRDKNNSTDPLLPTIEHSVNAYLINAQTHRNYVLPADKNNIAFSSSEGFLPVKLIKMASLGTGEVTEKLFDACTDTGKEFKNGLEAILGEVKATEAVIEYAKERNLKATMEEKAKLLADAEKEFLTTVANYMSEKYPNKSLTIHMNPYYLSQRFTPSDDIYNEAEYKEYLSSVRKEEQRRGITPTPTLSLTTASKNHIIAEGTLVLPNGKEFHYPVQIHLGTGSLYGEPSKEMVDALYGGVSSGHIDKKQHILSKKRRMEKKRVENKEESPKEASIFPHML